MVMMRKVGQRLGVLLFPYWLRRWEHRNAEPLRRSIASLLSFCVLTIMLIFGLFAGYRVWS